MEAEHHHASYMGLGVQAFNTAGFFYRLSARIRPMWAKNTIVARSRLSCDCSTIDTLTRRAYLMGHEGTCRSFPISFAEPPASPDGIGARTCHTFRGFLTILN